MYIDIQDNLINSEDIDIISPVYKDYKLNDSVFKITMKSGNEVIILGFTSNNSLNKICELRSKLCQLHIGKNEGIELYL